MANTSSNVRDQIKNLLINALPEENLENYKIEICGTGDKCDGYVGDIHFVNLISTHKNFNFVLKCGKTSEALRKKAPIKESFDQEIYMYNIVFPTFKKFEAEHKIRDIFNYAPKCYGNYSGQNREVLVLQNLKPLGYEMWDKKLPLPRNYLEIVLKQYGQWHAISAAMQDQQAEMFKNLTNNLHNIWLKYFDVGFLQGFTNGMENLTKIWENDLDEDSLNQLKQLKDDTAYYLMNLRQKCKSFNVITHGDCWSNNFMYKSTGNEIQAAMLDWQLSGFESPINDIAYFLYTCVSEEDLNDFDSLLKVYYMSFSEHLRTLGSDPDKIYTYSNLLNDWKVHGRLGIIMLAVVLGICFGDEDQSFDMTDLAEGGEDCSNILCKNMNNVELAKQRTRRIIKHAVDRNFIKPIKF